MSTEQIQIATLQNEIKSIRKERDTFRREIAKMRLELATLKAHSEEADCELEDLKRNLLRKDILPSASSNSAARLEPIDVDTEEITTLEDSDIEILSDRRSFRPMPSSSRTKREETIISASPMEARKPLHPARFERSSSDFEMKVKTSHNHSSLISKRRVNDSDTGSSERHAKRPRPDIHAPIDRTLSPPIPFVLPATPLTTVAENRMHSSVEHQPDPEPTNASPEPEPYAPEPSSAPSDSQKSQKLEPSDCLVKKQETQININLKIKIKEEAFRLPPSIVAKYLQNTVPLTIEPPAINSLYVSRRFLRLTYGGSDQHFIAKCIAPASPYSIRPNGTRRHMIFPVPELNPDMPAFPGDVGLMLTTHPERFEDGSLRWSVFRRISTTSPVLWEYLAEQELTLCGKMSPDEFRIQGNVVKTKWAGRILKESQFHPMRARIALRKGNHALTEQAIEDELKRIKGNTSMTLSEEDVISAFDRGDEAIDIIKMKCVDYDHAFARDMAARFNKNEKPTHTDKTKPRGGNGKEALSGDDDGDWEQGTQEGSSSRPTRRSARKTRSNWDPLTGRRTRIAARTIGEAADASMDLGFSSELTDYEYGASDFEDA